MLAYGTKVNNLPNDATGTLTAEEWNGLTTELNNIITTSGQSISSGDSFQLAEAIAIYAISGAYYLDSGAVNTYTLTLPGSRKGPPFYIDGMRIRFNAANTNTGPSTANAAGLGSKAIKLLNGDALSAGNVQAGAAIELIYRSSLDCWILSQYINVTGDQTIFDKKTFSTTPAAGTDPATGNDLVRKSWLDAQISAIPINNYPINYKGSGAPVYATSTTFTVDSIQLRDSTNTVNISKTTSTTVNLSTTGLNGIAQSNNLTGTVTVFNGSTNVLFSNSQTGVLQAGDVITTAGGNARKLASGSGTSWTSESAFSADEPSVSVKRGGLAPNTHYNQYGIAKANGALPGILMSTRNVSGGDVLVDLPTDYIYFAQEAFAAFQTTVLTPFRIASGWPRRPKIVLDIDSTASPWVVLSSNTSTGPVSVPLTTIVPGIAVMADFAGSAIHNSTTSYGQSFMRPGGSATGKRLIAYTGAPFNGAITNAINITDMPLSSTKTVDYLGAGANGPSVTLGLTGYTVEVK